ncbi:MAG: hypothetical protein J5I93_20885 [Pirellulaceae bacterium]|nr:hypothetical protein [Pirellulaceae bacterium]
MKCRLRFHCTARFGLVLAACQVALLFPGGQVARAQQADDKQEAAAGKELTFDNAFFEAPVRLMVGDQPLNAQAAQMYPSPAMYDVDADGQMELVVGDIFGSLNVYENQNRTGQGDPVWSQHRTLKTARGEPIKVSNW